MDQICPPGAEISGLNAKLEAGPYEVKSDIKSVLRAELFKAWTTMLTFNASSGWASTYFTNFSPAEADKPAVGKPAVSDIPVISPGLLLTIIKPAAPASWAYFCLSVKVRSPRLTIAILPFTAEVLYCLAAPVPNLPFLSFTT